MVIQSNIETSKNLISSNAIFWMIQFIVFFFTEDAVAAHFCHTESARSWGEGGHKPSGMHQPCGGHFASPLLGMVTIFGVATFLGKLLISWKTSKFIVARNPDRWFRASKLATKPRTWMKGIIETCPKSIKRKSIHANIDI